MPFGENTKAVSTAFQYPAGQRLQENGDAHHDHVTCYWICRYGYSKYPTNANPQKPLCLK